MNDVVNLNTIILALGTLVSALSPILLALINRKQAKALANSEETKASAKDTKAAAIETAAKVEEVRVVLAANDTAVGKQLVAIKDMGEKTHVAVNSERTAMQAELKRMNDVLDQRAEEHARELKMMSDQIDRLTTERATLKNDASRAESKETGRAQGVAEQKTAERTAFILDPERDKRT